MQALYKVSGRNLESLHLEATSLAAAWKFARVIERLALLGETVGQGLGGHDVLAASSASAA
jgi:hypothetical protein